MKNHRIFPLLLIIICIVTAISGCTESNGTSNETGSDEFNATSEEESRQIAETYVRNLDSYREYNLTEPILVETVTLHCPYCWKFVYEFDLISEKDPDVTDTATVTVTVTEGEVVDAVYAQGSSHIPGTPTGSMGADNLRN
ncbi:hypothetical protein MSSIH_1552 [Methanosarcina siciliae HI350]|uniref:Uncharacterized protein n=1 Tax=Methanosarcina siciliae HI350 TaxID=1434119 RepID=A0A0E3PDQ4_9EURY|nr:hypothetical protein [Methanosarcina siciliae]AKB32242.1 hypothetical protein MSSIH_1552 [Methanosarcina siciliae HI350]